MIGSALEGRYRIEAELGSGGVGAVYRGVHVALNRPVAIKVLRSEYASSPEQRQRFEREARALASMSHPNIVAVTDFGVADDIAYIVMDLLEGETLAQRIKRDGPLPVPFTLSVMKQLLRALAFVHGQGLVHRDVKPPNVFLQARPEGELHVRLLDFGLAKVLSKEPSAKALTRAGQIFGTPSYMAPEQVAGQEVDARTDVYAAGIVLFEMLAGRAPFKGTAAEIFRQHLMEDLPMDAHLPKDVRSAALDAVLLKATAKTRGERYADGAEMLAAIDALAPANPTTIPVSASVGSALSAPESVTVPKASPAPHVASAPDLEAEMKTVMPDTFEVRQKDSTPPEESGSIEDISAAEIDPTALGLPPPRRGFGATLFRGLAFVTIAISGTALALAAYAVHVYTTPSMTAERSSIERLIGFAPPVPYCPEGTTCTEPPPEPSAPIPAATVPVGKPPPELAPPGPREAATAEPPASAPSAAPEAPSASATPEPETAPPVAHKGPAPNPWATTPRELAAFVSKVNRGKGLEKRELLRVHEFNAKRPDDPRGHLLLARSYSNRHWFKDAVNEYNIALKVTDNARGDPRMLPDLLRIVQFGSTEAERLVKDVYGEQARPAVDKAILSVSANPEAKAHLEKLRSDL